MTTLIARLLRIIFILVLFLISASDLVRAETFVVNDVTDLSDANPGDGVATAQQGEAVVTLRAAVEEASALPGPDTVLFESGIGQLYLEHSTLQLLDNSTLILGNGGSPVVDGVFMGARSSLFNISGDSCQISGLTIRRSHGHGVLVQGSYNLIGGAVDSLGCVLSGCGLDGEGFAAITVAGPEAQFNIVGGNLVGVEANGLDIEPNQNGVIIDGAAFNVIGGSTDARNVISGNTGSGVRLVASAYQNVITDNVIGLDAAAYLPRGNGAHGIELEDASGNTVGGVDVTSGNIISSNGGDGIKLSGSETYTNLIRSNWIGLDESGTRERGNFGDGVSLLNGAHHNWIGDTLENSGNFISNNQQCGVNINGDGCDSNLVVNNLIGLDDGGFSPRGNSLDGIRIAAGASYNLIGGSTLIETNAVAANSGAGVHLTGAGTSHNRIEGNFIGINISGTSSVSNASGLVIDSGASDNTVGGSISTRNYLSGNRGDTYPSGFGIAIRGEGTDRNLVQSNYIGLDYNGVRALRNGSAGVMIGDGARDNLIGGDFDTQGNVISGNGSDSVLAGIGRGVHLIGEGTTGNLIQGNIIGLTPDLSGQRYNAGHGIGVYAGASHNVIGGDDPSLGNLISGNYWHGIYMTGPNVIGNLVRNNQVYDNDSTAIYYRDGAQGGMLPPTIVEAVSASNQSEGYVTGTALPYQWVDVYQVIPDGFISGGLGMLLGQAQAGTDGEYYLTSPLLNGVDEITAVAVAEDSSTSVPSRNVLPSTVLDVTDDEGGGLPVRFALHQNYPNPFNPATTIAFELPRSSYVRLEVYDLLGRHLETLIDATLPAGRHQVEWQTSQDIASGVYFYRMNTSEGLTLKRKMLLLK